MEEKDIPNIPELTITPEGIFKLLKNITPNKASGPDNISCRILKEVADSLSPYLQLVFSKSLKEGNVPNDWLVANISALFKKGDKSQPVNYRPVSLTSVPCKIMEHVIFKHIMDHLDMHDILVDFQHGFRSKRSCESQLVITTEDIARNVDNNQQVDMLILDFSKAFDTVPHQRLLKKLKAYGIRGNILAWIESWLTQREQCVTIEGAKSRSAPVTSGVPQGTVLGPLMFLLYINDIGNNIISKIRLFADDSLLYLAISSLDDCKLLQKDLDRMVLWTKQWQMIFNPLKCYVLKITRSKKPVMFDYTIDGHILETVKSNPYLGVELTDNMSWEKQVNKVVTKGNKALGFIRRNLGTCPEEVKKQAYLALVRPHLEYASSAWDPHLQKHTHQIEMVQRRASRFITGNYSRDPGTVTTILQHLELTPLATRRKIARLTLLHKTISNKVAINIPDYILQQSRRSRNYHPKKFIQPRPKKDVYKYSFFPRTIREWNSLPEELIQIESSEEFKSRLTKLFDGG